MELSTGADGRARCGWCGYDPLYMAYHDDEWGRPPARDVGLFEKVCLEGFQAGLAWITILRKREAFRRGFSGFDPTVVAAFGPTDVDRLMGDAGIVRHRGKIESVIANAGRALALLDEFGTFGAYFEGFRPVAHRRPVPGGPFAATSPESVAMSKDLKRRGWTFVGPTTMYAFMQSVGLVDDHLDGCWTIRSIAGRAQDT